MNPSLLADEASRLAMRAQELAEQARMMAVSSGLPTTAEAVEPFIFLLAIFLMACFVGYYVVWNVTPALHSPLMAVTNAISSVIVVGALLAVGVPLATDANGPLWARILGFLALILASVNIFGGFLVTSRMLAMYKKKDKPSASGKGH
jgi:NAD(P) transhydrogenase subunit alpha